jgi:hypothetical protein
MSRWSPADIGFNSSDPALSNSQVNVEEEMHKRQAEYDKALAERPPQLPPPTDPFNDILGSLTNALNNLTKGAGDSLSNLFNSLSMPLLIGGGIVLLVLLERR